MAVPVLNQSVKFVLTISFLVILIYPETGQAQNNMEKVKSLAKAPVDEILKGVPVYPIEHGNYWKVIHKRNRPVIIFFYINKNPGSQRLATLIHFVAEPYKERIDFFRFKTQEQDNPNRELRNDLQKRYGLDDIPGILFYDNVNNKMVLEKEDYIDADFKEFRTPEMFLWETYYNAVKKELDKLLSD